MFIPEYQNALRKGSPGFYENKNTEFFQSIENKK